MPLFQSSVLKKHLKALQADKVSQAYDRFTRHFHNPIIQENIRNSKEEQYQGEFLIDLFVNVLGYVKNPTPDFNLTTELKNIKGSKKTDGAILKGETALAVIELKGTATTDLSKVETQAFGYKNNQPGCNYVITSNFEKLRFYIDNAVEFEEFNLFQLTRDRFDILWLCLSSESLLSHTPKKIKDESLTQEERVTKKLYKDYAAFRNEIFDEIQKENPEYDKLTLFKKTQKLLDRFLFIFFAEDRLLLPPNSIRSIVNQWTDLRDKYDAYSPLYDRFKKYFGYMNTGHKGQHHSIFAYNGGLFEPDEILDTININDDILYKHTLTLSNYDFESEVSVNILGHIFEHSLNDIDEIQAEIQGTQTDKSKSKRKKDGVFYTPKYITKYIVDNTVGKLCAEQKETIDIREEEYEKERKGRQKATVKKLAQKLEDYREWLLNITICDPACGSGAFLSQALEFLIAEHKYIDELNAKLFGDSMVLSKVQNAILENNIYGVDINEESVDIAKLSLWLRTAQKGRKLTSLNNNIKCGNSLIDDPEVAGDKAFNWQEEFPNVFSPKEKEAFHIVLTTHNSRYSPRMKEVGVKTGEPVELNLKEEIALTEIIRDIVIEHDYNILAYNICRDHVHMILVCEADELTKQVQRLKSISSKLFNKLDLASLSRPRENVPLEGWRERTKLKKGNKSYTALWSQKFHCSNLTDEGLAELSNKPGEVFKLTHYDQAIPYINENREKHNLPTSKKLNSIISEFVISEDEAFALEYSGGFDVVIGNPPYVSSKGGSFSQSEKEYYACNYKCAVYQIDLYLLFNEKCLEILNKNGIISLIEPNAWMNNLFLKDIRKYLLENTTIHEIVNAPIGVFKDATVDTVILTFSKTRNLNTLIKIFKAEGHEINYLHSKNVEGFFKNENFDFDILVPEEAKKIVSKMEHNIVNLIDITDASSGIKEYEKGKGTPPQTATVVKEKPFNSHVKLDDTFVKHVSGSDVTRFVINWQGNYLKYGEWIAAPRKLKYFKGERLIIREIPGVNNLIVSFTDERYTVKNTAHVFRIVNHNYSIFSLLGVLNSKLMGYYFRNKFSEDDDVFPKAKIGQCKKLPIPVSLQYNMIFDKPVKLIILLMDKLNSLSKNHLSFLQSKFSITKLSRKLENWHELDAGTFLKELAKAQKKAAKENETEYSKLTLSEEAEWIQYFSEQKKEAEQLKSEINKTDREIDAMVYELYDLTEEEIAIVEEATT